ncbi:carbohydrate ABC transporter permease, partial [Brachyspira aalborgi]|uniref:carbohydrate ABC transporter permease n=1 Tax=Brachyspira aalborgi TaxID=29522 RepID=UPI0034631A90
MINKKTKENIIIILFLAPALLIFIIFILYPVFNTIYLSFYSWKGIYGSTLNFVGFDNYIMVLKSDHFYKALLNSLYFLIGGFVILMPLSFLLALLITSKLQYTKL